MQVRLEGAISHQDPLPVKATQSLSTRHTGFVGDVEGRPVGLGVGFVGAAVGEGDAYTTWYTMLARLASIL